MKKVNIKKIRNELPSVETIAVIAGKCVVVGACAALSAITTDAVWNVYINIREEIHRRGTLKYLHELERIHDEIATKNEEQEEVKENA